MPLASPCILTINGGSSSIKFAIFEIDRDLKPLLKGEIARIGSAAAIFTVKELYSADDFSKTYEALSYAEATNTVLAWLKSRCISMTLIAIGHRVVQGGPHHVKAERLTPRILSDLQRFCALDPEHLPNELALIDACQQHFPQVPGIACFDTVFHHDLPRVASVLPIPRRFEARGIRKYGFHGLSYAFLMEELVRLAGKEAALGRVILAHLGNGSSLAAVHHGKAIDTSMSFSPASGVMMGTRSGDLDPSLVTYLIQQEQLTLQEWHDMVHFQSGLLGISEISADMRTLLQYEASDVRAMEAIAHFCYCIKKCVGGFTAALGGIDTLIFAGGIGENAALIRARICTDLEYLGIVLDPVRNESNDSVISSAMSKVCVCVMVTDEQQMMARIICREFPLLFNN